MQRTAIERVSFPPTYQFKSNLANRDRNWLTFQSYLDSIFATLDADGTNAASAVIGALEFLNTLSATDNLRDRGSLLVLLELERRIRTLPNETISQISEGRRTLGQLLELYFSQFGDKACCFEDLLPYVTEEVIGSLPAEREAWVDYLKHRSTDVCIILMASIQCDTFLLLEFTFRGVPIRSLQRLR